MATRERNERRFSSWEDLPNGHRRYIRRIMGRVSGYALYVKLVDADEITLSITQEIYNANGRLIAIHQKYPVDTGHQDVSESEDN
ncbi:MAG: hypothetical protein LCI00_33840 [Chloroflexi bacterium]|nr:hypothetical protein [Chloroflexota bacterium]